MTGGAVLSRQYSIPPPAPGGEEQPGRPDDIANAEGWTKSTSSPPMVTPQGVDLMKVAVVDTGVLTTGTLTVGTTALAQELALAAYGHPLGSRPPDKRSHPLAPQRSSRS
jgi:hypothetical protein